MKIDFGNYSVEFSDIICGEDTYSQSEPLRKGVFTRHDVELFIASCEENDGGTVWLKEGSILVSSNFSGWEKISIPAIPEHLL